MGIQALLHLCYFLQGVLTIYASHSPSITFSTSQTTGTITSKTTHSGYPTPHGYIELHAWDRPNCEGQMAFTVFDSIKFARNLSNYAVSRSFRLSRPPNGQEQLDLSLAADLSSWYSDKDQLSQNSSSCNSFKQSYFASNGTTQCHNTPAFTCHRLWINTGLPQ